MRTGVSYMGHHNPKHLKEDVEEIRSLGCDDVLVAMQENDFVHFPGKIRFTPKIAKDLGVRPIAIFWGALNLFGGGKSSQFLLEYPEGLQVSANGSRRAAGCYVNRGCVGRIKEMVDEIAEAGFEGYFVDEPHPLKECYCRHCRSAFENTYGGNLAESEAGLQNEFRRKCVIDYVSEVADYCKENHPQIETMCCLMPGDRDIWGEAAGIRSLDNLGTDIYLVNSEVDVEEMTPLVREVAAICKKEGKTHHEWLQSQRVRKGREDRILDQGRILVRERPDAIYVWAWQAQVGMDEESDDVAAAWGKAVEVLRMAKE